MLPVKPSDQTPEVPDIPLDNEESMQQNDASTALTPAPTPQFNGRIWPWPAKDAWDERQVYREVVSMLELIKTGKLTQTAQQLDNLGPHLDGNLDMLSPHWDNYALSWPRRAPTMDVEDGSNNISQGP